MKSRARVARPSNRAHIVPVLKSAGSHRPTRLSKGFAKSDLRPRSRSIAGIARHDQLRASTPVVTVLKFVAAALAVVLVSGVSIPGIAVSPMADNIKTVALSGEKPGSPPNLGSFEGGVNVLIVGSDTCANQGAQFGKEGGVFNDVTMLVHVSKEHSNAVAVRIPRDLVMPIPACPREDGKGNDNSMSAQPSPSTTRSPTVSSPALCSRSRLSPGSRFRSPRSSPSRASSRCRPQSGGSGVYQRPLGHRHDGGRRSLCGQGGTPHEHRGCALRKNQGR